MQLESIVEALIFSSQNAITSEEIAKIVRKGAETNDGFEEFKKVDSENVLDSITKLKEFYEEQNRSFTLLERPQGWKIGTKSEFSEWAHLLYPDKKTDKLSAPALETLAIIAYRQPVTKAGIEVIRGVSVDGVLNKLIDRDLVQIGGRSDLPGRPMLYETTESFFDYFGISSVEELPNSQELRKIELPTEEVKAEEVKEEQLTLSEAQEKE